MVFYLPTPPDPLKGGTAGAQNQQQTNLTFGFDAEIPQFTTVCKLPLPGGWGVFGLPQRTDVFLTQRRKGIAKRAMSQQNPCDPCEKPSGPCGSIFLTFPLTQ
jgi:hypothetical protein